MRCGSLVSAAVAVAVALAAAESAYAQARTGSSTGLFGSRTIGSGAQGMAGDGGITGGFGAGGLAAGGVGAGGLGTGATQTDPGAGSISGNERFLRESRQPGQFVGADTGDLASFVGAAAGFDPSGMGGLAGSLRALAQQAGRGQAGNQQSFTPVRTTLIVAFDYPRPEPAAVRRQVATRLQGVNALARLGAIEVEVQERTAFLRGQVATAHDRAVAERIVLLEPGVSRVENLLSVAGEPAVDDAPSR